MDYIFGKKLDIKGIYVTKIQFKPGFNKQATASGAEGNG
jgi:hypothetical protein